MAKRKHSGIQQDAVAANLATEDERNRSATHYKLVRWLEERGFKPNRLLHYRDWKREGKPTDFYVGPTCKRGHQLYGAGSVRRAQDHTCLSCTLHHPQGHSRIVPSLADRRRSRRQSHEDRQSALRSDLGSSSPLDMAEIEAEMERAMGALDRASHDAWDS